MRIRTIGYVFLSCVLIAQSVVLAAIPQFVFAEESPILNDEVIVDEAEVSRLVISAVQITGGTGKTQEDFIELYNPTNEPFNLNGHRLVKRTASGTTDTLVKEWIEETIVLPYHFYLWVNSTYADISINPDTTSTVTLSDNNGIALRLGDNDAGEILDSLAWGNTSNGFENRSSVNPTANQSLVKTNLLADSVDESVFVTQESSPRNSSIILESEDIIVEEEEEEEEETEEINIRITEILPNPSGSDAGVERIELYNAGSETVNLENFALDDISEDEVVSSNAYVLSNITIDPNSYKALTIPVGKFSLNNTGGDTVSLFDDENRAIDSMFYEAIAQEGKSYSLFDDAWEWSGQTFGRSNGNPPKSEDGEEEDEEDEGDTEDLGDFDNSGLEINEVFPQPSSGNEFIEIYNNGNGMAQLAAVTVYIGERKRLLENRELEPGEYYVIEQDELPVQLRNSGQTVMLRQNEDILSAVTYPLAIKDASFARFEDGFLWTTEITKSTVNALVIPEVIKKEISAVASKTAVKKTTTPKVAKKTVAVPKGATAKTTSPQSVGMQKPETVNTPEQSKTEDQVITNPDTTQKKESLGKIIAMGAAAVAAGVAALYKLVFTQGVE